MKMLIMTIGLGLGILYGLYPGLDKPRTFIWKLLAVLFIAISLIFTLLPPLAGTLETADRMSELRENYEINIEIIPGTNSAVFNNEKKSWELEIYYPGANSSVRKLFIDSKTL